MEILNRKHYFLFISVKSQTHRVTQDQRKIITLINGQLEDIRSASDLSAFRQLSCSIFFSQFPDKRQEESITVFEPHLLYRRSESNRWVRLRSVTISDYRRQLASAPLATARSGMRGTQVR